jgi:hypothetical protein
MYVFVIPSKGLGNVRKGQALGRWDTSQSVDSFVRYKWKSAHPRPCEEPCASGDGRMCSMATQEGAHGARWWLRHKLPFGAG